MQQAAESALISARNRSTKRDLFAKHAAHLNTLAAGVERAMAASNQEASASTATCASGSAESIQRLKAVPVLT
jgi:hypothetical protein